MKSRSRQMRSRSLRSRAYSSRMSRLSCSSVITRFCVVWLVIICSDVRGIAQQTGRGQASPAAQPPARTETAQEYSHEQVEAGRTRFGAQCGFCHGRDAAGGEGGPDLTRSALVAADVRGDRIGPVVRTGRNSMPPFNLSDTDLIAIVAYIHDQKTQADSAVGGRRSVDVTDLQTGNSTAGKRYFDNACTKCHSATGDLSGLAARLQGLQLLQ